MPDLYVLPEEKSLERMEFEYFMRTGRVLTDLAEFKFGGNPYHDTLGRFTSAGRAVAPRFDPSRLQSNAMERGSASGRSSPAQTRPGSRPKPAVTTAPAKPVPDKVLSARRNGIGALSAKFESGKRGGPGTIANTPGDKGGFSYGSYQIATRTGDIQKFIASPEASPWASRFKDKAPTTVQFNAEWRKVAEEEPEKFEAAQKSFIVNTHYTGAARRVLQLTNYNLNTSSTALRQVLYSTAKQHGLTGGSNIFAAAVQDVDSAMPRTDPHFEVTLIITIYDRRMIQRQNYAKAARANAERYARMRNPQMAANWAKSARLADNDVNSRYQIERYDALRIQAGQGISELYL